MQPFDIDWAVGKKSLTSSSNSFVIHDGSIDVVLTIPVGDYWLYKESGSNALEASYPGIYDKIESKIALALGAGTFTLRGGTSTRSPFPNSGLVMESSNPFTLRVEHASFTMDPRIFGLNPDAPDFGDLSSVDGALRSPYSIGGNWRLHRRAASKYADEEYEQYDTGEDDQTRWRTNITREMIWNRVPAALFRESRAGEHQAWATSAALALWDTHNNLERLWRETLSKKDTALIVHDHSLYGGLTLPASGVEACRLADKEQRDRKSALFTQINPTGEHYTIRLVFEVLAGNYTHS